jgi:hypothetical protein
VLYLKKISAMKKYIRNWICLVGTCISLTVNGQSINSQLELEVIKETLPQLLNNSPNSAASLLKNGGVYKSMVETLNLISNHNTLEVNETLLKLNKQSDSLSVVLSNQKIVVFLSDTLFAYKYYPYITKRKDGDSHTIDLKIPETWENIKEHFVEVFQTDYKYRGLKNPVDIKFIDLIYDQINLNSSDIRIELKNLNNSYYEYRSHLDSNSIGDLRVNGVRLYRPVFNKKMDKACYLFSFQARNGPFREFVFVEKQGKKWVLIESYGSHHIDFNEDWYK